MRPTFRRHMLPPSRRLKKLAPSWRRSVQGQNVLLLLQAITCTLLVDPTGNIPCNPPHSRTPSSLGSLQRQLELISFDTENRGGKLLWNFSTNQKQYKVQTPIILQCARSHPRRRLTSYAGNKSTWFPPKKHKDTLHTYIHKHTHAHMIQAAELLFL